jgi:exopolyphosphatase/guanosine-5'-triphosphate,3'-diphosphate pyrophosphatase
MGSRPGLSGSVSFSAAAIGLEDGMVEWAETGRPRLAAIDVGTNTIRLVVAEVEPDGGYRVLDDEREMTRLGQGLGASGRIGRGPFERSLDALCKMRAIADGFGVKELRVVATSAVREAANGLEFRKEARRRCRIRLEVISTEEEAQLAFKSVSRLFQLDGRGIAVVDIGGGSVEVVLAAGGVIHQVHSLPLGAVRLTERYVRSDPLADRHWKKLRRRIDRAIRAEIGRPPFVPEVMIGSGGTFTNLGEMVQCEREGRLTQIRGYEVTRGDLVQLLARLRDANLAQRRRMCGLNPKRADIILAGAASVTRLAKHLKTRNILVNDRGIRDGLLVSMIEELGAAGGEPTPPAQGRMEWIREFARRCHANERHGNHVARLAVRIWDQLQGPFELRAGGRDVLEAAGLLHDVGYLINHAQHHKHAYHLIMHGDLRGFSPGEIELIANVARYHRRAIPRKSHENFGRLDVRDRHMVRQLGGILRVSAALDRTHGQVVEDVRVSVTDARVRLQLVTRGVAEVELSDARRKSGLFEKAFDTRLTVGVARPAKRTAVRKRGAPKVKAGKGGEGADG